MTPFELKVLEQLETMNKCISGILLLLIVLFGVLVVLVAVTTDELATIYKLMETWK
jgi:hypothetical protein